MGSSKRHRLAEHQDKRGGEYPMEELDTQHFPSTPLFWTTTDLLRSKHEGG
jgi:hypothetical protein